MPNLGMIFKNNRLLITTFWYLYISTYSQGPASHFLQNTNGLTQVANVEKQINFTSKGKHLPNSNQRLAVFKKCDIALCLC